MAGVIDLRGGDNNSEILAQMLIRKQQAEQAKEELKIRQQALDIQMQEHQAKQAQQAAQQQTTLASFMQAQRDPNLAAMTQPALAALGNANVPNAQAFGMVNAVAAPRDMGDGNKSAPSVLDQRRADMEADRAIADAVGLMTPDEGQKFRVGMHLLQIGLPKEKVDWFIPETAIQKAQRIKVELENKTTVDTRAADQRAYETLTAQGFKLAGPAGASAFNNDLIKADRAFKREMDKQHDQQEFTAAENAKSRIEAARAAQIKLLSDKEDGLRKDFQSSDVVKRAGQVVQSYGKVQQVAQLKTGPGDVALAYAFINMQDQTAAREGEQKILRAAGSIEDRISARFGKWQRGTVFSDDVREQIVKAAEEMMRGQQSAVKQLADYYTKNAKEYKLDPSRIIFDPIAPALEKIEADKRKHKIDKALRGE